MHHSGVRMEILGTTQVDALYSNGTVLSRRSTCLNPLQTPVFEKDVYEWGQGRRTYPAISVSLLKVPGWYAVWSLSTELHDTAGEQRLSWYELNIKENRINSRNKSLLFHFHIQHVFKAALIFTSGYLKCLEVMRWIHWLVRFDRWSWRCCFWSVLWGKANCLHPSHKAQSNT